MDVEIVPFDPKTASPEAWARFNAYRRPRHRWKGRGRSMLRTVVEVAEAHDRSVVESWVEEDEGKAAAKAIGARVVQTRYENRLSLDAVDWAMVGRWVAEGPVRSPSTALLWF